ncbi:6,7-dimethyl-8-ribityllumazine synthase [Parasponia andersonii]|uniref:6,7-dimethyl-8-ribityllumazine synthase n=1 Tax=Parasponia andersonii TaxID=3476 RepID=A0A2P5DXG2_PARAD|nr:6,7-dimethyl-8-ribityllumazine synthase [Parasponia andersonii]
MGNSLRCCLACVLPCGALDLIRIVHLNGYVEEITRPVTAGEILEANPNHVLSKPCSQGVVRRILILSPESELKRGSIYFLIPASSVPDKKKSGKRSTKKTKKSTSSTKTTISAGGFSDSIECDPYLSDIISEKKSSHRDRRSGRVCVWRPHLESISED